MINGINDCTKDLVLSPGNAKILCIFLFLKAINTFRSREITLALHSFSQELF
jgi:hypothetical protein